MGSVSRICSSVTDSFSLGQCVVLPYGLNWLAAGVEDVTPQPNEVQILYLYLSVHKTFIVSEKLQC